LESTGRPPGLREKGTIAVGADADVAIFNPNAIIDKATFGKGFMTTPAESQEAIARGKQGGKPTRCK